MSETNLYAVTGVSGRTGAAAAQALINTGIRVRVIVRNEEKGRKWAAQGAEVAVADLVNSDSLYEAFVGTDGVYIVSPPQYYLDNLFEQADEMALSIANAATKARIPKLVALSSVGAEQSSRTGWIAMNRALEQNLSQTNIPVAFLRAAYFMENWQPLIELAIAHNALPSFLSPLSQKLPMIATKDIGQIAANILCENWEGTRIIDLEGPTQYSPNDVAEALTSLLNRTIKANTIPESDWQKSIAGQGFSKAAVAGFIEMTQGLNSTHIAFNDLNSERRQGSISLDTAIKGMIK